MSTFAEMLNRHELLLFALVLLIGIPLGRLAFFGVRLGVAGVLFAGLGLSALAASEGHPVGLATSLRDLGLVLFVYCIGLQSGPGFFSAWRERGIALNLAVIASLLVAAAVAAALGGALDLDHGHTAGVFAGALTNTPALAAVSERLAATPLAQAPAIGYSVAYPFGVLGAILALRLYARLHKRRLEADMERARAAHEPLANCDFRISNTALDGKALGELRVREQLGLMLSRVKRGAETFVPNKYTVLKLGDLVAAVGPHSALDKAAAFFGEVSDQRLENERVAVDMRRILVSQRALVGQRIQDLDLGARFGAQVTRLRRADLDILPSPDMRLELGDRLRVVAPASRMTELTRFFGDSERALAQLDFVALAMGLALGLLVAQLTLPSPGAPLSLGLAGGPLLVALVLGRLGRTGPLVWQIPYEANTTLRELGLVIFLAGVGVSAGGRIANLPGGEALAMFALGATVTLTASFVMLTLVHRFAKTTTIATLGATTGMQTQPASLAVAYDISGHAEDVWVTYAIAFPFAMIGKILIAQLLVTLL